MSLEEDTREYLKVSFRKLLDDLYTEIAYALTRNGQIEEDEEELTRVIKESFEGRLEDLPKIVQHPSPFAEVAKWRLENPEATLDAALMAALSYREGHEGSILDEMFKDMGQEGRSRSLSYTVGEAQILADLYKMYGMEEQLEIARSLRTFLPEIIEGWLE